MRYTIADFKIFNIIGDITPNMDKAFSDFLSSNAFMNPHTPILITINSTGGHVPSGFSIFNKLIATSNPVYTLITGDCHSIASVIYLAAPFERRFAFPYTSYYIHDSSTGAMEKMKASEIKNILNYCKDINKMIGSVIKERTKIPSEIIDKIFFCVSPRDIDEYTIYSERYQELGIGNLITSFDQII